MIDSFELKSVVAPQNNQYHFCCCCLRDPLNFSRPLASLEGLEYSQVLGNAYTVPASVEYYDTKPI